VPLSNAASKPGFMCNLTLEFMSGSNDGTILDAAVKYTLADCWVSDVQLSDPDYATPGPYMITATVHTRAIIPFR